jgi:hypothetical protein
MDISTHFTTDSNQTDPQCGAETDRLVADSHHLREIREQVRRDSDRSVIQRAWDVLLGPSRDRQI